MALEIINVLQLELWSRPAIVNIVDFSIVKKNIAFRVYYLAPCNNIQIQAHFTFHVSHKIFLYILLQWHLGMISESFFPTEVRLHNINFNFWSISL